MKFREAMMWFAVCIVASVIYIAIIVSLMEGW